MDVSVAPRSIDPGTATGNTFELIEMNIYETLLYFNYTSHTPQPWLAQSYTVSGDGLTYDFILRQGIKFADGTPFNATAVRFSLYRFIIMGTGIAGYYSGVLKGVSTFLSSNKTSADITALYNAGGIVVVGANEVKFNLQAPDAGFNFLLSMEFLSAIVSPAYVNQHGGVVAGQQNTYLDSNAGAGTGPYTGVYQQSAGAITLTANPTYWGSPYHLGPAKIQTITFKITPDSLKQVLDLKSGQANVIQLDTTDIFQVANQSVWSSQHVFQSTVPRVSVVGPLPSDTILIMQLNGKIKNPDGSLASSQPFSDIRVRQAMAYAFDQQTFIQKLQNGLASPLTSVIPPGVLGYKDLPNPYPFNLNKSKALLTAAGADLGFSPSHPITVSALYPGGEGFSEEMLTLLASNVNSLDTGFVISVVPLSGPQFLSAFFGQTAQIARTLWGPVPPDPGFYIPQYGDGNSGILATRLGYNDSRVTALDQQQATQVNATLRAQLVAQAAQLINEDAYYVWGSTVSYFYGTTSSFSHFTVSGEANTPLFYFIGNS